MTADTTPKALDALVADLSRADEYAPLGHDGWRAAAAIAALRARAEKAEAALAAAMAGAVRVRRSQRGWVSKSIFWSLWKARRSGR